MKRNCRHLLAAVIGGVVGTTGAGVLQMPSDCTTPDGMCVDPKGRLVIAAPNRAHTKPGAIFRLDAPGGIPQKWFEVPVHPETGYAQPMGVCFGPKGELYVCDCNAKGKARLLCFTFENDRVASCQTVAEGLDNANGVKFRNGFLYVTQAFLYGVKRGDGAATSGLYRFAASDRNVRVRNLPDDPQCVFSDVTRNPAVTCGLNGVAIDSKGVLYVNNYGDGRVWKFTLSANGSLGRPTEFVSPAAGVKTPDGMCVDDENNLYIADMRGGAAVRVSPKGVVTFLERSGFNAPSEPCVWRGGLYVANFGGTTVTELPDVAVEAKNVPLRNALARPILPSGAAKSSFTTVFNVLSEADVAADAAWRNLKGRAAYDRHRADLKANFIKSIGGFPETKGPLNARTVKTVVGEGYRAEKVIYESQPGVFVTGLLFLPDEAKFAPPYRACLVVCGHSEDGKGSPGYQRACVLAAQAGMAAFIIDPIGQGERLQDPPLSNCHGHNLFGVTALLVGQSMARYRLWDAMRALDYFGERTDLLHDGYGVMGNSGGGTMSALLCAVDSRITVAAPSCYLSSLREVCRHLGPQDAEQNIFGQFAFGLNHAGLALMGDNAVRLHCCHGDYFPFYGSCETWRTIQKVIASVGLDPERYGLTDVPGPHGWKESTRVSSVQWMRRWLMGEKNALPIDVAACRSLDLGFDLRKVPYGLDDPKVTPEGAVAKLPGFRSVYRYLEDALDAALVQRKSRSPEERAALVRSRAMIRPLAQIAHTVKDLGSESVGDVVLSRRTFTFSDGIVVPAVMMRKASSTGAPVLMLTHQDRSTLLSRAVAFLEEGRPVLLADLLAAGEIGSPMHLFYGLPNADEEVAVMLYMLGKNIVGVRAEETLVLADALRQEFGKHPSVFVRGRLAVPVAHALAAEPGLVTKVEMDDPPPSWTECVRHPVAPSPLANAVQGGLLDYDWTDLLK